MPDLLGIGTNRGYSMIGLGIGLGCGEFRLPIAGFSPDKITGLRAWWDATDASTLYQASGGSLASLDGDPLGEWRDKSGSGNHWVQAAGTNKPALRKTVKNLKDIIRFDGVNDFMAITGSNSSLKSLHDGDNTIFVVMNVSSLAAPRVVFDSNGGTTGATGMYLGTNSTSLSHQIFNSSGTVPLSPSVATTAASYIAAATWYVFSFVSDPANATAANRSYIYKNAGSLQQTNTSTGTPSSANSLNNLMLGGTNPSGGIPFVGDFGEIIIYDSALSAGNRALVENYLNNKWGVY